MIFCLLLAAGCRNLDGEPGGDDSSCPPEAVASVRVQTVDGAGAPVVADAVEWSVAGSDWMSAECAQAPCFSWVAGWEVAGEITVRARRWSSSHGAPACTSWASETVEVVLDEHACHVVQQEVTLALSCG